MSGPNRRQFEQADPDAYSDGNFARDGISQAHATVGESPASDGDSLAGTVIISGSTLVLNGGELAGNVLRLEGTGQLDFNGGTLRVGTVEGTLTQAGGTFVPFPSPSGVAEIRGDYYLGPNATLRVQVDDQLTVDGSVDIDDATLEIDPASDLGGGQPFTIVKANGPVKGTFAGLEEGTTFDTTFGDKLVVMRITYGPTEVTVEPVREIQPEAGTDPPEIPPVAALEPPTEASNPGGDDPNEDGGNPDEFLFDFSNLYAKQATFNEGTATDPLPDDPADETSGGLGSETESQQPPAPEPVSEPLVMGLGFSMMLVGQPAEDSGDSFV